MDQRKGEKEEGGEGKERGGGSHDVINRGKKKSKLFIAGAVRALADK